MATIEQAGVPAVGIFGQGFHRLAELLAEQAGLPRHRLALYPQVMATQADEVLVEGVRRDLYPQLLRGLLGSCGEAPAAGRDDVAEGSGGQSRYLGAAVPVSRTFRSQSRPACTDPNFDSEPRPGTPAVTAEPPPGTPPKPAATPTDPPATTTDPPATTTDPPAPPPPA